MSEINNVPVEVTEENIGAQVLYSHLRTRTIAWKTTGLKDLTMHRPEGLDKEALTALVALIGTEKCPEELKAIGSIKGRKDTYYYEKTLMTPQYADIDVLVQEKDILRTIASVTRNDSALYPIPTLFSKLMDVPFKMTMDEILGAASRMKFEEQYADIGVVTASNGGKGFYSSQSLTEKYAQSLIEWYEVELPANP